MPLIYLIFNSKIEKTVTFTQTTAPWCGGNACTYCGNCRDWIYNDDIDCGNNSEGVFDKRRWYRNLDAKCFYGYDHFPPYHHHHDADSTYHNDSIRFYNRFAKDRDRVPKLSDDSERCFYAHFDNVCKCV
ncbi:unnamed protein product [Rotaria socialis]|uniref:Uncharacterized protein n=1 Tax=Rotaria socialis TaxID=392032 RepID=A0A820TET1_9BILA|nr:unnamed protein product [Rotaria socialis]